MKKLIAALAISLIAFNAHAQGFVEFGLGQSKIDLDANFAPGIAVSSDEKDTTWAISGGYMFHPMIGAEVGYRDLGKTSLSATNGVDTVSANAKVDGFTLGAVGRIPVGDKFSIVPRFGFYMWDGSGQGFVNGVQVISLDDDGTDPYFGVGAEYAFSKQVFAGAHFVRFDVDGDDVDVFELKVGFRF